MSPLYRTFSVLALVVAVVGLALAGGRHGAATPLAGSICANVTTYVVGVGHHDAYPPCFTYSGTTTCNYQEFGLAPSVAVTTTVCAPRP